MRTVLLAAPLLGIALPCLSAASPINGDVRLVGSIDYYYEDERRVIGRLVTYYNGNWGNVNAYYYGDEYFGDYDTEVACQQLGDLEYYYYDNEGWFYPWPEDTGLVFLERIDCDGTERHLSECAFIDWIADPDEVYDHWRSISCSVLPAEDVTDPEFVFDMGFSDSGVKCLRADGVVRNERLYGEADRRRRRGDYPTPSPTASPLTPTPLPTPLPTYYDFEAHLTSTWEVAACSSVYSGADDDEVEISHKGQLAHNEICARRADGQPWTHLYLRLLCRAVDLNSSMVSYTSKGSCGPRGDDAVADTSRCLLGASAVATVHSEPPIPAAVVEGCAFFFYAEYVCLEDLTDTSTATSTSPTSTTTATGCADYVPPEEEKWHDADGEPFDCAWYAGGQDCSQLGGSARNFNHTADEACCACGGGVAGPRTTTTRTTTTASATRTATTATTASAAPGARLHEVTGSLRFSSTGSQQQVEAAAAEALAELLGVPASKVAAEASPATAGSGGRRLTGAAGWWQVSYTVWSTMLDADTQRRSVAELASNQASTAALFAPRFEAEGLQLETSTLEITEVDVAGATFTDTTTTTTSIATTATTTAAQAGGSNLDGSATTDDEDQLPFVLVVVAVVLAGVALMVAGVALAVHRCVSNARQATNDTGPMKASAEAAGIASHASEVLAV